MDIQNVKHIPVYKLVDCHDSPANKSKERSQWVKWCIGYLDHMVIDHMDWQAVAVHKLVAVVV